jgi:cytidylate kinase
VSEERLHKTLDELPSLLGVNAKAHALYLAYIEEAVLAKLSEDRVVCHGLAAHLYVRGVSHAFKVRVLADPSELIRSIMREKGVSPEKAAKDAKHEEALRSRWSLDDYRVDETAPSLYDLVIDLSRVVPEEAVRMIMETSSHPKFKPMTYSVKSVNDMELQLGRVATGPFRMSLLKLTAQQWSKTAAVPREKGGRGH